MSKKKSSLVVGITIMIVLALGANCAIFKASPSKGQVVELLEGDVLEVSKNYVQGMTDNYVDGTDKYQPKPVKITWESKLAAAEYTVRLGTEKDLSDASEYKTVQSYMNVSDLYRDTKYFYQIIAHSSDGDVKSKIFNFETADLPRTISIEGISNTRDIGGYKTEDGEYRVKQGMVYRGAALDNLSSTAKEQLLDVYGIRTDLDLRGELKASPLGDAVNFINVSGPHYAVRGSDKGIQTQAYREALLAEIRAFADAENFPIYMHCQIGRDRTGTLAFLINSLLGVGAKDLYLDYELSFLSQSGSAGYESEAKPSRMLSQQFDTLFFYIEHSLPNGTWAEKTAKALMNLGVTEDEIAAIRKNLLEEVK